MLKAKSISFFDTISGGCHVIQFPADTLNDSPSSSDLYKILSASSSYFSFETLSFTNSNVINKPQILTSPMHS